MQEEVKVQVGDVQTLTKRNQDLSDKYTRIDIECNRVSEDLHLAVHRPYTERFQV